MLHLPPGRKKLGGFLSESFVLFLKNSPAEQFIHALAPRTAGPRALKIVKNGAIHSKTLGRPRSFAHIFYIAQERAICQTRASARLAVFTAPLSLEQASRIAKKDLQTPSLGLCSLQRKTSFPRSTRAVPD